MTTLAWTYVGYLVVSVGATIWAARALNIHAPKMIDSGEESKEDSFAITHLLTVGFYLINVGAICVALRIGNSVTDVTSAVELLSTKVGVILVGLGAVHFMILIALGVIRKSRNKRDEFDGYNHREPMEIETFENLRSDIGR
ncbi:MAG: hypothetical protein CMJ78_10035 [Planctomycetaceae bacterium]|nr:hypothetical protein [Planctomycetaceae bacterium]